MQIIKPLHSVFLHKSLLWRGRHISSFSAGYFFQLDSGALCFEPTAWASIVKSGYGKDNFDEAVFKSRGEFIVVGNALAPQGQPVPRMLLSAKVGKLEKRILVSGERCWNGTQGTYDRPIPFVSQVVSYRAAFGGAGHAQNPVGKGLERHEREDGTVSHPLPLLEYPDAQVMSVTDTVPPAAFASLAVDWGQRQQWAGTYDTHYLNNDIPGLPSDIDWRFFQLTTPDQWNEGFWSPDEEYSLTGMNSSQETLAGRLPNIVARCFVRGDSFAADSVREIPLQLDTLWFFPNDNIGLVLFRGAIDVKDMFASDIKGVLCALERANDERRSVEHYLREFEIRSDREKAGMLFMHQAPLMPEGFTMNLADITGEQPTLQEHTLKAAMNAYVESIRSSSAAPPTPPSNPPIEEAHQAATGLVAMIEKVFPPLRDSQGNIRGVDLGKADLSALPAFLAVTKDMRNKQLDDTVARLREDLQALESVPHSEQKAARVIALSSLIASFTSKPVLTRPPLVTPAEDATRMLEEAKKKLEQARESGDITGFLYDMKRRELDAGDLLIARVTSAGGQGYRLTAHYHPLSSSPHPGREAELTATVIAQFRAGAACHGAELAFCTLDHQDLTKIDLSDALLEYTSLRNSSFRHALLTRAVIVHAAIIHCEFDHANLDETNLGKSDVRHSSFRHCSTRKTNLTEASFTDCVFENCDFSDSPASFLGTQFSSCTFTGCIFNDKIINNTTLEKNTFIRCHFNEAILNKCTINQSIFDQCTMKKTNFIDTRFHGTSFHDCDMDNARFHADTRLVDSSLNGSTIHKANMRGIRIHSTTFVRTRGDNADFSGATLEHCNFEKYEGVQSQWVASVVKQCHFFRAHLLDASFLSATLDHCNFTKANLFGVMLLQSTLRGNDFHDANLGNTLLKDWQP